MNRLLLPLFFVSAAALSAARRSTRLRSPSTRRARRRRSCGPPSTPTVSELSFLPKGFAVDLDAFTSLETNMQLGFGLTHTWTRRFVVADRFAPTLGLTAGPWLNYGAASGKVAGGLYVGFEASW